MAPDADGGGFPSITADLAEVEEDVLPIRLIAGKLGRIGPNGRTGRAGSYNRARNRRRDDGATGERRYCEQVKK